MRELSLDPRVAVVEPVYIRRPFRVPSDTHYLLQWNLKAVQLEQAWDRTTGSASIVVAVLDTGIIPDHPDLKGRLVAGYDFVSDSLSADDGDGWDSDPRDNGTNASTSSQYHGTLIAGIIGATSNNGQGITGVDWSCKIQPIRVLGVHQGKGTDPDIAAGIRWAAGLPVPNAPPNKTPAQVICMPFGGPGHSNLLEQAIKDARATGAVLVAAAGNNGGSVSGVYPAVAPGVVTVGATQLDGTRAPYSNYGPEVDIMAPGGNMAEKLPFMYQSVAWSAGILSTSWETNDKKYIYVQDEGTSQAAALVSGVIALMLSADRALDPPTVLKILEQTAGPASRCSEGCGAGLVNAAAALSGLPGATANGFPSMDGSFHPTLDGGAAQLNPDDESLPPRSGCACGVGNGDGTSGPLGLVLLVLMVGIHLRRRYPRQSLDRSHSSPMR